MYIDKNTLDLALISLYGTAGHMLKIWFVLKQMGLSTKGAPVEIDTKNSTEALKRLFSCGSPSEEFYVPFAHTQRYLTMKGDAARSIIQTTIRRWISSDSVVTCNPSSFLDMKEGDGDKLLVAPGRKYPEGLGFGEHGFAVKPEHRTQVPLRAFSIWYGRQTCVPDNVNAETYLVEHMLKELGIAGNERGLIFVEDMDDSMPIGLQAEKLSDADIFSVCQPYIGGDRKISPILQNETFDSYTRRLKSMTSKLNAPAWMRRVPFDNLRTAIESGEKAILLYGPPRTGKTRSIDKLIPRTSQERATIQIHDGWGYDNLVEGFTPARGDEWGWKNGPLKEAIDTGKKYIVLEEINRTEISQALGEIFSLIEESYRGKENAITLRSGTSFSIPSDVVFIMTMNTIDKSTVEIDDALLGRVAAVEFPPRVEDLNDMLNDKGVSAQFRDKILNFYVGVLEFYPLGHGYFAGVHNSFSDKDFLDYYLARIRPVIWNNLGILRKQDVEKLDELADSLFAGDHR